MSTVGESTQVIRAFADADLSLVLGSSASMDAELGLVDPFGLPTALDADRCVLESGLLASPDASPPDDDYLAGDSAAGLPEQSALDFFNMGDYINETSNVFPDETSTVLSDFVAASYHNVAKPDPELTVFDSEVQVS